MREEVEETGQPTNGTTTEELTCPLCESPLIGEAIEAGKCQCCGHRFQVEDLKKSKSAGQDAAD